MMLLRSIASAKALAPSNIFRCTLHHFAATSDDLKMDNIYLEWSLEDDKILHSNRHLSTVRLASMLGRGMHGVEARMKKISNVDSAAYRRLFGGGDVDSQLDESDEHTSNKLTPVKEVLRRIQYDPTLDTSSFSVLHYDRVEDAICEVSFDAENNSVSGNERRFVFALPEHRIEAVKYLDRIVWDKETRLDLVFGSMNGRGETIDEVVENYDEWKREKKEKEERNRLRQVDILKKMHSILEEMRVGLLKEMSSKLMHSEWDSELVKDYVKRVVQLYFDAKKEKGETENDMDDSLDEEREDTVDIVYFLNLFSDLVALLPNERLRGSVLLEVELVIDRHKEAERNTYEDKTTTQPGSLPELNEDEIEEKFVKGSGAGGQKINKTNNRVVLIHTPTKVRVECQDTRSLQQNRKIARKRLRLKLDAFFNGDFSREGQKASAAVAKKAKNKARNKRRRKQKSKEEQTEDEE